MSTQGGTVTLRVLCRRSVDSGGCGHCHMVMKIVHRTILVSGRASTDGAGRQVDGHDIVGCFGRAAVGLRVELDGHCGCVHNNAQISVVCIVVAFERECAVDLVGCTGCRTHCAERRMAAAASDQEGNLKGVYEAGVALIAMRMAA